MIDDKLQCVKLKGLRHFWIIGAGRFGKMAVERITRRFPQATIKVVDHQTADIDHPRVTVIRHDAIDWLAATLHRDASVDVIIPAIPVHVAAEWIKRKLLDIYVLHSIEIPDAWIGQLPHAIPGAAGQFYVSHADFICPDNCPEPKTICTHTGEPRPGDLFRLLAEINLGNTTCIILRSHQLEPGVGGLLPADLISALDTGRSRRQQQVMVATACRCHGVVDFIGLKRKGRVTS